MIATHPLPYVPTPPRPRRAASAVSRGALALAGLSLLSAPVLAVVVRETRENCGERFEVPGGVALAACGLAIVLAIVALVTAGIGGPPATVERPRGLHTVHVRWLGGLGVVLGLAAFVVIGAVMVLSGPLWCF